MVPCLVDTWFVLISRRPHGGLEEIVDFVWLHQGEAPAGDAELRLPTGDLDLVVDFGEEQTVVSGPSTRPFPLGTAERREVMGAVFRIGGAAALLGVPVAELRDRRVPLAELWGSLASELLERPLTASSEEARLDALEQVLSARLGHIADRPHPVAGRAAAQIARYPERCRVAELGEALGLSARRLEQLFHKEVGLTPKAYQRLHRFRQALVGIDRAAEIGWATFALERGYYDQSHFIGEFRAHSGLTPSEYVASRGTELNHVPITV
jgi:AraC-like DNA-binding protein